MRRRYKMTTDRLPFLPKGAVYEFDDETGNVYRPEVSEETPLRSGIADYLWLLLTEDGARKKYLRRLTI